MGFIRRFLNGETSETEEGMAVIVWFLGMTAVIMTVLAVWGCL